ncbi:uncharacterized protein RAG0_13687 [Rhynchosporium agropyri]|uniref:2EXR domain-containing protein n=1 Tax=Rhynchosporium agropyri TaxID=914238 RepID=A0A1E1LE14_9HELO|nr:uncharacterized protein RAG0_13687 [Rhynchosporium agropyri]
MSCQAIDSKLLFPTAKFTLLMKLPPEIRIKIWKLNLTPRIVCVEQKVLSLDRGIRYTSSCPPPEMINVCKESRLIPEKSYKQAFVSTEDSPGSWFNFDTDILYLNSKWPLYDAAAQRCYEADRRCSPESFEEFIGSTVLAEFPELESLTIAKHPERNTRNTDGDLVFAEEKYGPSAASNHTDRHRWAHRFEARQNQREFAARRETRTALSAED